jgi:hypothetical protein
MPYKFGGPAFMTDGRIQTFQKLIADDAMDPRMKALWDTALARDTNYVLRGPLDPFIIPAYYDDPDAAREAADTMTDDFEAAADFAYRWAVNGDVAASKAAVKIIDAYSKIKEVSRTAQTMLSWCDHYPILLQAANVVSSSAAYTSSIDTALKVFTANTADMTVAYDHENNWAAWGVCFELSSAALLEQRDRFDKAIQRWRWLMDHTLVNNVPILEVYREGGSQGNGSSGLYYANFHLSGMSQAAEWARFNGEWLYDYTTPDGSTLEGYWENVANWTRYPEDFPYNTSGVPSVTTYIQNYVDIMHTFSPNADSQYLVDTFTTTQDYYGLHGVTVTYRYRPLYG